LPTIPNPHNNKGLLSKVNNLIEYLIKMKTQCDECNCLCREKINETRLELYELREEVKELKKLLGKKIESDKIKINKAPEDFINSVVFAGTNAKFKNLVKPMGEAYGIRLHYENKKNRLRVSRKFEGKYERVSFSLPHDFNIKDDLKDVVEKISEFMKEGDYAELASTGYRILETDGKVVICSLEDGRPLFG
jgi:hypothetical protein